MQFRCLQAMRYKEVFFFVSCATFDCSILRIWSVVRMKNGGLAVKMVIDVRAQNLLLPMLD